MSWLIQGTHTVEECMHALDELAGQGPERLKQFYFGCGSGDHSHCAIVDAKSEAEARALVPDFLRAKTRVSQIGQFSEEQIKGFHAQKAAQAHS